MGKRELRMNRLVDIIHSCGYMPIRDIAQMLKVSEMTVRRDLAAVEKSGLIKNVNGVVVSGTGQQVNREYIFESETKVQNEAKALIGRFGAGSFPQVTVSFLTPAPPPSKSHAASRPRWSSRPCVSRAIFWGICAACRMPPLPWQAASTTRAHRCSPAMKASLSSTISGQTRCSSQRLACTKSSGISCANSYEVATKRAILKSARQHILVADSSKFGVVRSAYFCDLADIDTVVTDNGLAPEWVSLLKQLGVTLYLV